MVNKTDSGVQKRTSKRPRSAANEDVAGIAITLTSQEIPRQSVAITYQDLVTFPKDEVKFKTGSNYKGNWNSLGMSGDGKYKIFHGVDYDGYLDDGMFHGQGIMWYPNNSRVEGVWNRGFNEELKYYYNDGLVFEEKDWTYCVYPDRRFKNEYLKSGIRPTGRTMLSDRIPPRPIPPGCYDTGDGFYNPATKCVTHPYTNEILRIPTRSDELWIMENCRKSSGLPLFKFEDSASLSTQVSMLEIHESEEFVGSRPAFTSGDEEEPVKEEKGVGRFEIVQKMVQNRAYRSKYILLDKQRNRGCKKHRIYLPTLKVKTKLNIFPDLRVTPPYRCIHEKKSIVTNKLLLLLKLLRTCENAGGVSHVDPKRLKNFRKEFLMILREEEATQVQPEVESDLDIAQALSHQLDSFILASQSSLRERGIVFSYNIAGSRMSAVKTSQHRALRAKELAVLADMWPPPVEEKEAVDNVQVRAQKELKQDDETKCDICLYLKELDAKKLLYRRAMLKILKGREETDSEIFEMTQTIVTNFIDYLMQYINEAILKIQRDIINELIKRAEKICKKRQEEKVEELKKQFKTVVDEIVDEAVSNTLQPIREVIDNVIATAISRIVMESKVKESEVEIDIKKSDAKVESMQNIMKDVVSDLESNLPDLMKTEMVKGFEKEQTIEHDTDIVTKTELKYLEQELSAPSEKEDKIPSTTEVTVDIFTSADKYRERYEEKKHVDDIEIIQTKQPNLQDDKKEEEFVEESDTKPELVLKEGALFVDLEAIEEEESFHVSSTTIPLNEPLDQQKPLHFSDVDAGEGGEF